jgi:hypothetical protein
MAFIMAFTKAFIMAFIMAFIRAFIMAFIKASLKVIIMDTSFIIKDKSFIIMDIMVGPSLVVINTFGDTLIITLDINLVDNPYPFHPLKIQIK